MDKCIFEKFEGKKVKISLRPHSFVISGYILSVLDECIEFKTDQKVSYIDFDMISSVMPFDDRKMVGEL